MSASHHGDQFRLWNYFDAHHRLRQLYDMWDITEAPHRFRAISGTILRLQTTQSPWTLLLPGSLLVARHQNSKPISTFTVPKSPILIVCNCCSASDHFPLLCIKWYTSYSAVVIAGIAAGTAVGIAAGTATGTAAAMSTARRLWARRKYWARRELRDWEGNTGSWIN